MAIPDAAVIEIVEKAKKSGPGSGSVIIPNDVRVNGVSILAGDEPVVIHEMTVGCDVVKVTLTLFARRVIIGAELD